MIFETHAHYDDEAFDRDRDSLIESLPGQGIGAIVNISSDLKSIQKTTSLSEKYPFVYAAVGIHPCSTGELIEENFSWIKEQCGHKKTVAVGEIGLDYHWNEPEAAIQKKWFERQLLMAQEVCLPVVIHSREAAKDTLDIMREMHAEKSGGVIHCFSYTKETAAQFLKMGFFFGIGGVVTFDNAKKIKETVAYLPMDSILLETDSPYLSPSPNRGERNCSLNLTYIAEEIARIKGISSDRVIEAARKNGEKLFGVKCG